MILVVAEHKGGQIRKQTLEAVSQAKIIAQQLNTHFSVALVGDTVSDFRSAFAGFGVKTVFTVEQPVLAAYTPEGYVAAVQEIVKKAQPDWIFIGATSFGRDLGPRLAARLKSGLVSDCTAMEVTGGDLFCTRPVYAGKALAKAKVLKKPGVVTLRPNVFSVGSVNGGGAPAVEAVSVTLPAIRTKVLGSKSTSGAKLELTEAQIIVSGGRGLKGPEHFHLVEDLAGAIGAAAGASRAVVDAGWRSHEIQVGQTGKTVSPNIYIACGISGAIQHLAGMSSSKHIIAINKDPDAPIFKIADLGVVGDIFEILPLLTDAIKKAKS